MLRKLARKPLRGLNDLLERRPVLERERRQRDGAGDCRAVAVEARRLRVVRAVAAAVEVLLGDRQRVLQAGLDRLRAALLVPAAAVDPRPAALDLPGIQ